MTLAEKKKFVIPPSGVYAAARVPARGVGHPGGELVLDVGVEVGHLTTPWLSVQLWSCTTPLASIPTNTQLLAVHAITPPPVPAGNAVPVSPLRTVAVPVQFGRVTTKVAGRAKVRPSPLLVGPNHHSLSLRVATTNPAGVGGKAEDAGP